MLDKLDLTKKLGKAEYKEKMQALEPELGKLQRELRELNIPVMIVFEGYDAAGKGVQIGELLHALDPRGFEVHALKKESQEEQMYPFLWRFWTKTPARGRIAIYDSSWYRKVLINRFDHKIKKRDISRAFDSICSFEQQLSDDGMVIIKIFLAIDKKEQKKRFDKLLKSKETAWRVSDQDKKRHKNFDEYKRINEEMLTRTDTDYAPWNIVAATDRRYAAVKIYSVVIKTLTERLEQAAKAKEQSEQHIKAYTKEELHQIASDECADRPEEKNLDDAVLARADMSLSIDKELYKKQLEKLQLKMEKLHGELYRRRIPLVIGFEGWDAGGKGGAIKRLTEKMDPRGYVVHPTASPNDIEKAHHYLWRFWTAMPKAGHVTIFDRTWYGRVMVERIEGFCTKPEWQRAYQEINNMERDLTDAGAIVLKFWMQIDKEEQKRRFEERLGNPQKQWKITDEDWRNREKWDQYEEAVNEMILRTSTLNAPWIVVEGNCKYYARIKVLRSVIEAIEKKLG